MRSARPVSAEEIRYEITNESDLVVVSELVGGQGDKQDGDMGDGAMVSYAGETADTRLLNRDDREPAEYAFDGRTSIVVLLEHLGAVWDLVADAVGDTPEVVASFLLGELGVPWIKMLRISNERVSQNSILTKPGPEEGVKSTLSGPNRRQLGDLWIIRHSFAQLLRFRILVNQRLVIH